MPCLRVGLQALWARLLRIPRRAAGNHNPRRTGGKRERKGETMNPLFERAIELAEKIGYRCSITLSTGGDPKDDTAKILVYDGKNPKTIDAVLALSPNLIKRSIYSTHEVWGETVIDDVIIRIACIDTCKRIETEETVEEPEMVATGKTITKTVKRIRFECDEAAK